MKFSNFFKIFTPLFVLCFAFTASAVWVAPSQAPTAGNTPRPISTQGLSTDVQEKLGTISAGGLQTLVFKLAPGAQQNYVLVSDTNGYGSWVDPSTLVDGGGNVNGGGTGMVNFLTKWLDPATLTNSQLFDNGTNVGINTTTPAQKLDISGNTKAIEFCLPGTNPTGGCIGTWNFSGGGGGGSNGWTDIGSVVRLTTSTDKVGVGTTLPSQQLSLEGNFELPNTNFSGSSGVIYKKTSSGTEYRFIFNSNTSGAKNIFMGRDSGSFSMSSPNIIGIGDEVLENDTSVSNTIAIGSNIVSEDINNVIFGNADIPDGSNNVFFANTNSINDISGDNNVRLGHQQAGDGDNNTAVGEGGLTYDGSDNTMLGRYANYEQNVDNSISIGRSALTTMDNEVLFGNITYHQSWGFGVHPGSEDAIRVGTDSTNGNGATLSTSGTWTNASDRTKKHDIEYISYGLSEVLALRPVEFKWNGTNKEDIGFIAQEVKEVIPEVVHGEEGDMGITYGQLNSVLAKAVQELKEENDFLKQELDWLEAEADRQGY